LWAVLTGLFFMHGAASLAGGCQGGPLTAVTAAATPVMPGEATAGAVTGTAHQAGTGTLVTAAQIRHAAAAASAVW
jgi:hypothetical protein